MEMLLDLWKEHQTLEKLWNTLDWKEDDWKQDRLKEIAPEIQELQENITPS